MCNEELREANSLPDIVTVVVEKRISWAGMWHAWERNNAYVVIVGKPEGKRLLGRPRRRCEDANKDPKNIRWCGLDPLGSG